MDAEQIAAGRSRWQQRYDAARKREAGSAEDCASPRGLHDQSVGAFYARRDKEGALKLIKSRETAAIGEIAPKVGRMIFGNPGAAKAEGNKAEGVQKANPSAGFTLVPAMPKPQDVDHSLTSDAMKLRGKFVMKDGRKLQVEGF